MGKHDERAAIARERAAVAEERARVAAEHAELQRVMDIERQRRSVVEMSIALVREQEGLRP